MEPREIAPNAHPARDSSVTSVRGCNLTSIHWQESINDEDVYREAQIEACWDVSFATNGPSEEDSDGDTHSDPARTAAPFIPPHVEGDTCMCNEKNLRLGLQMRNHPNY